MRPILPAERMNAGAQKSASNFHSGIIKEVDDLSKQHEWLIVGMKMNPVVKSAKKNLDAKGIKYHYVEYGSYFSMWKPRLALKLWAGWPTYPMVFNKGILIGGNSDLERFLKG